MKFNQAFLLVSFVSAALVYAAPFGPDVDTSGRFSEDPTLGNVKSSLTGSTGSISGRGLTRGTGSRKLLADSARNTDGGSAAPSTARTTLNFELIHTQAAKLAEKLKENNPTAAVFSNTLRTERALVDRIAAFNRISSSKAATFQGFGVLTACAALVTFPNPDLARQIRFAANFKILFIQQQLDACVAEFSGSVLDMAQVFQQAQLFIQTLSKSSSAPEFSNPIQVAETVSDRIRFFTIAKQPKGSIGGAELAKDFSEGILIPCATLTVFSSPALKEEILAAAALPVEKQIDLGKCVSILEKQMRG